MTRTITPRPGAQTRFIASQADPIGTRKQAYRKMADPTFETYGPKTDSEYEALIAERGGLPA